MSITVKIMGMLTYFININMTLVEKSPAYQKAPRSTIRKSMRRTMDTDLPLMNLKITLPKNLMKAHRRNTQDESRSLHLPEACWISGVLPYDQWD